MQSLFREKRLMGSNDHIVEREQTGQDIIIDNLIRFILVEIVSLLLVDIQSSGGHFLGLQSLDQGVGMNQ